ncbi:hypothetical protein BC833DRAFT_648498 [Globomyces pollinis-pini]|nr:hypothetical protein BC833DRAFT_648498 [Globomyces pollinis-pini]
MSYTRYSRWIADSNGDPKMYSNRKSFHSHKKSMLHKRPEPKILFPHIDIDGKVILGFNERNNATSQVDRLWEELDESYQIIETLTTERNSAVICQTTLDRKLMDIQSNQDSIVAETKKIHEVCNEMRRYLQSIHNGTYHFNDIVHLEDLTANSPSCD